MVGGVHRADDLFAIPLQYLFYLAHIVRHLLYGFGQAVLLSVENVRR